MDEVLAILLGLIMGGTVGLILSAFWLLLDIPLRVQAIFDAGHPRLWTMAITLGTLWCSFGAAAGFSPQMPDWAGGVALALGGGFVGMLASALGEALDMIPNIFHRLGISANGIYAAWGLLLGKSLGAVLAAFLFTL